MSKFSTDEGLANPGVLTDSDVTLAKRLRQMTSLGRFASSKLLEQAAARLDELEHVVGTKQLVAWHYYERGSFHLALDQDVAPDDPIRASGCPLYALGSRPPGDR